MRIFLLLLITVLTGCGYHVSGSTDGLLAAGKTLHLGLFTNRTAEPRLEGLLYNSLDEVFGRHQGLAVVPATDRADLALQGTIETYSSRALSYDRYDNISEYRATLAVSAQLYSCTDQNSPLWQGYLSWDVDYAAADNKTLQRDLERQALRELGVRLAEDLYDQLRNDF